MAISTEQKKLISYIDLKVKTILEHGGNEDAVLVSMQDRMPEILKIIQNASEEELQMFIDEYNGFYLYMKMLETIAMKIRDGVIQVPQM